MGRARHHRACSPAVPKFSPAPHVLTLAEIRLYTLQLDSFSGPNGEGRAVFL